MNGRVTIVLLAACTSACSSGAATEGGGTPPMRASAPASQSATRTSSPSSYTVTQLGNLGGAAASGASINGIAWIAGSANNPGNQTGQATLWKNGQTTGLGTLGGPNSAVAWPNHNLFGLISGISETAQVDPLGEDWSCSIFFPTSPDTHHICLGFTWRDGTMTELPTLGGVNGYAAGNNNLGQIAGWAETAVRDSTCTAVTKFPNSLYQVLQFEPVVWQPGGRATRLSTLPGDPDGAATAINDFGTVVGISGTCDQAAGRFTAAHAVIWQNGKASQIPNIGGISWNTPTDVNDLGQVVGFLNEPGDTQGQLQPQAFVWSPQRGLTIIKPLPGDTWSQASGINDFGQVVGVSYTATTSRAFLWQNGKAVDLNGLLPADSPLYVLAANDINDRGEITGQALVQSDGNLTAFLAAPGMAWLTSTQVVTVAAPRLSPSIMQRIRFRAIP